MDADFQQRIENAPDGVVKAQLRQRLGVFGQQIGARAATFEHGMEIRDTQAKLGTGLDRLAKSVYRDPTPAAENYAHGSVQIDEAARLGNLDPQQREKLKRVFGNALWGAYLDRGLESDPTGTAAAIQTGEFDQYLDLPTIERLRSRIKPAHGDALARGALSGITSGGAATGEGRVAPQAERIAFARQYTQSQGINPDAVVATMGGEGAVRRRRRPGRSNKGPQLQTG
jgi:hypothetical protein